MKHLKHDERVVRNILATLGIIFYDHIYLQPKCLFLAHERIKTIVIIVFNVLFNNQCLWDWLSTHVQRQQEINDQH